MTNVVCTSEYSNITNTIENFLSMGKMPCINIFVIEDGSVFEKDSNGNDISARNVKSITNTETYVDPQTNLQVKAYVTINFDNGSTFTSRDDLDSHWYTIQGASFPIRSLIQ